MSRYEDIGNRKAYGSTDILSKKTTYYDIPGESDTDMYFITQQGDKLDNLAYQYYGDANLWWFLARVNYLDKMNVEPGLYIRVPINPYTKGK